MDTRTLWCDKCYGEIIIPRCKAGHIRLKRGWYNCPCGKSSVDVGNVVTRFIGPVVRENPTKNVTTNSGPAAG